MKIKNINIFLVSAKRKKPMMDARVYIPVRNAIIVEIETDEDIKGIGESMFAGGPPSTTMAIIEKELKKYLMGENPLYVEKLWEKMYQGTMQHGRSGAIIAAYSGMDLALWDIKGKILDKPVYEILGGFHNEMMAYASAGFYEEGKGVDELVSEINSLIKEGFKAVKIKIGRLSMHEDLDRVKAVRDAIGEDILLMVDANNVYTFSEAIKMGKKLGAYNIFWFEEPLPPENIEGMKKVSSAIDIPLAAGELVYTRYGFKDLIVNSAINIIQPDVTWCGGLTEGKKIVDLASAWQIPFVPHSFSSAIFLIANGHLTAASANALNRPLGGKLNWYDEILSEDLGGLVEFDRTNNLLIDELIKKPIKIDSKGKIRIPDKSGLGFDLNEKTVKKFKVQA